MTEGNNIMPDFTGRNFRFGYLTALNILSGMGVDLNRINIKAVGTFENYRGEIRSQDPEPGEALTSDMAISLEIGSQSAVDYMPYQFFYGLRGARDTDRSWEDRGRALMAPFDSAVIRHRAQVRFSALQYEFGIIDDVHLQRFLSLFDFDPGGGEYQRDDILLFVSLLPSLYLWGGNPDIVTDVLSRLFGYQFRLRENIRAETDIPEELRYRLGEKVSRLGRETVIGPSFSECDSSYQLTVLDVPAEEIPEFLPGGKIRGRIERVLDYCMPGELDCMIEIEGREERRGMGSRTYLGYSAFV
ncbi:MAG: hypothetical protein GF417_09710 [Candidatus Latescibacteria bacterium]|nr:hypothetical protein [bacterium]MBD3424701.1 hypothetical protein [Candidatus Latescibacterota bacterium]